LQHFFRSISITDLGDRCGGTRFDSCAGLGSGYHRTKENADLRADTLRNLTQVDVAHSAISSLRASAMMATRMDEAFIRGRPPHWRSSKIASDSGGAIERLRDSKRRC
jgi:hypothetical protein